MHSPLYEKGERVQIHRKEKEGENLRGGNPRQERGEGKESKSLSLEKSTSLNPEKRKEKGV